MTGEGLCDRRSLAFFKDYSGRGLFQSRIILTNARRFRQGELLHAETNAKKKKCSCTVEYHIVAINQKNIISCAQVKKVYDMVNEYKYKELLETLKGRIQNGSYSLSRPLPSIRYLIRRFKVSKSTVLRAFDEMCQQGLIVRRQGSGTYVNKPMASRTIGLIVPGVVYSEFYAALVSAFSTIAQENGYTLLFGDVKGCDESDMVSRAHMFIANLLAQNVCGVIYQPLKFLGEREKINQDLLSSLRDRGVPVILLDTDIVVRPRRSQYDIVSIDNIGAGAIIAEHLSQRGARNICFLMRAHRLPSVMDRYRGIVLFKHELGVTSKTGMHDLLVSEPDDLDTIRRFMRRRPFPDAFVCENDTAAALFVKSLKTIGFSVPDDVMVAGFDDVQIAKLANPSLTSVHQPCEIIANTVFQRLMARIHNPDLEVSEILLPSSLTVRESTNRTTQHKKGSKRK